jgi:hypothetical protein
LCAHIWYSYNPILILIISDFSTSLIFLKYEIFYKYKCIHCLVQEIKYCKCSNLYNGVIHYVPFCYLIFNLSVKYVWLIYIVLFIFASVDYSIKWIVLIVHVIDGLCCYPFLILPWKNFKIFKFFTYSSAAMHTCILMWLNISNIYMLRTGINKPWTMYNFTSAKYCQIGLQSGYSINLTCH